MEHEMNSKKRVYTAPKIEKLVFDPENIIITSGIGFDTTHEAVGGSCSSHSGDKPQSHSRKAC